MAKRITTKELKDGLDQAQKSAESLLKVFDSSLKKIQDIAKTIGDKKKGFNLINPKDLAAINKLLVETEKLQQQRAKTDLERNKVLTQQKKVEQELQKVNQQKNKTILEQEKINAQRIRTEITLTKEKERQEKIAKREIENLKKQSSFYRKLTASVNSAQMEFKELAAEFGVNSKQAQKALNKFNKLDDSLRKINNAAKDGRRDVGRYGIALKDAFSVGRNILGGLGLVGGIQLIGQAFRDGIETIRSFELETSRLAGLLGTTSNGIQALTTDAERLGSTTAKTASEVVQLQQAYARLGFSQEEIINLTEDTINGSLALNASLDETAELTGAVVRTFDDFGTQDAGKILDQLTLATQKSALNFGKLQTALPIVSGAANTAGVSFTELVALLGKLSDSGIDASSSATALRNIFIESSAQGLNYEEILDNISNNQDKLTASVDEFGKRAAVSSTVLANNLDGIKDLDKALQNADGTAKQFADETLDTLDGSIKLLSSAYEGFVLSLGQGDSLLSKTIRGLVELTTATLSFISGSNKASDSLIKQRTNINLLTDAITDENISQESRLRLINKLQKQYPEYLSNLNAEKITNEELRDVIKQVNEQLINKIRIQINQEKINEAQERLVELIRTEDELRLRIAKEEATGKRTRQLFALKKQLDANVESQKGELEVINELSKAQSDLNIEKVKEGKINKANNLNTSKQTKEIKEEEVENLTGAIEKQRQLVNELRKDKDEANEEDIAGLNKLLEIEEKELQRLENLGKEEREQIEKTEKVKDKAAEEDKKRNEESLKAIQETTNLIGDIILDSFDARNKQIDAQIQDAQNKQDQIVSAINSGSQLANQSLADQEKRQAELQAEQDKLNKRRLQVEGTIALLNAYAENGDVGETLSALSVLSNAVRSLPGFYDGTDDTGTTGVLRDEKGVITGYTHENEMVINAREKKELNALGFHKRNDILELARNSTKRGSLNVNGTVINVDNKKLLSEFKEMNKLLKTLPNNMPIHNTGITDNPLYIQEVIKTNNVKETTKRRANGTWA